jgi:hypothetical protein
VAPQATLRPGQLLFALPSSYCTDKGTHGGYPAVDAFAARGTPIYAPYHGRATAHVFPAGGNAAYFYPDPGQTTITAYYLAHGNVPFKAGRWVQGQQVGQVGNTGAPNTAPHLHFAGATDGNVSRGPSRGSGNVWFEPWVWGQGAAPAPTPQPPKFRVTVDGLRLRQTPGADTKVIGELPAGAIVTATIVASHAWRRVKAPDGTVGWVADTYLEET